jgi:TRAP-type mannitol/chloroaromatic compound transport system permease small subunit
VQAKGGQATIIDRLSELTGRLTAWLTLAMVLVTCLVVILRYVFDIGFIWLQESVTWMHAVVFMLGAAYTLEREEHVRVDVFYRRFGERGRAVVDLLGVVVFLLPLCGWIGWSSWDFVATSWRIGEASRESGGLPYPMVPLLKSVLVVMPAALALQGLSLGLRSVRALSLEPGGER